ncbi:MAG: hypothetical protein K2H03_03475 [Muribaculaceae bacterium]|nr:hypothetical protein [Muribaculaceae bacterium]
MSGRRHFTSGETVAACVLIAALLMSGLVTWCGRHPSKASVAAAQAADSAFSAKADSLDLLLKEKADTAAVKAKPRERRDSAGRRRKSARPKSAPPQPKQRSYLDETLSPDEAR